MSLPRASRRCTQSLAVHQPRQACIAFLRVSCMSLSLLTYLLVFDVCMQVVHEYNEVSQAPQLSSSVISTPQPQQAAAEQLASVCNLIVSPSGRWAAVTRGCHVHVFDLDSMTYYGRLPALQVNKLLTTLCSAGKLAYACWMLGRVCHRS